MKKALLFASVFMITLLTAILIFVLPASAEDVVHSGKWGTLDWTLNETTGELVISGEGEMHYFSQGATDAWLAHKNSIQSVTIGDGITSIGDYAFYECANLTSAHIPDGVTEFAQSAFFGCVNLTSITLPNSVTSIRANVFARCRSLKSIRIPNGVTEIPLYAFYECTNLESVTLPDGITTVGYAAFADCTSLESISIPEGVTSIEEEAFRGCSVLNSITLPTSITYVAKGAFSDCVNLTKKENGVLYVDKWAIGYDKNATGISLRDNTVGIADDAFRNCTALTSITLPNNITRIGTGVFAGCVNLTDITFSEEVTHIGKQAFEGCTKLIQTENGVSYVNKWVVDCDRNISVVSLRADTVGIADQAFEGCTGMIDVTIPKSVTVIGYGAFLDCMGLTKITVGSGNEFYHVAGNCLIETATNVLIKGTNTSVIPEYVTEIGDYAFYGCSELTYVIFPTGITRIGDYAFYDCTKLTSAHYHGNHIQWYDGVSNGAYNNFQLQWESWDEGKITTEPTVDAEGVKTFTCVCGKTKTEPIAKLPPPDHDSSSANDTDSTDGGCGAVVSGGMGMMALIALAGGMIAVKKKK